MRERCSRHPSGPAGHVTLALSVLLWKGVAKPARRFAQLEQDWFVDIPARTEQTRIKAAQNIKGARSGLEPGICLHCSFI